MCATTAIRGSPSQDIMDPCTSLAFGTLHIGASAAR